MTNLGLLLVVVVTGMVSVSVPVKVVGKTVVLPSDSVVVRDVVKTPEVVKVVGCP
jgi:hypothetical protein